MHYCTIAHYIALLHICQLTGKQAIFCFPCKNCPAQQYHFLNFATAGSSMRRSEPARGEGVSGVVRNNAHGFRKGGGCAHTGSKGVVMRSAHGIERGGHANVLRLTQRFSGK